MSFVEFTNQELLETNVGDVFVFDVETYPNYFLIAFRHIVTNKVVLFEDTPVSKFDRDKLQWLIWRACIVGFNSNNYDILMMKAALNGYSNQELFGVSSEIIFQSLRPRDFEERYGTPPMVNHIDLIEVAPLKASLKLYGGRLHCTTMQDLPFDPSIELTKDQAEVVKNYCCNDLEQTVLLLTELAPHIELRVNLGREYGRDMRSLSDAQVAEAIISCELYRESGYFPRRPKNPATVCTYHVPAYMQFQTPALQQALAAVAGAEFIIGDNGSAIMPDAVKNLSIQIGGSVYKMGIGGLHSQESEVSHKADDETDLIDRDVASYYPQIILNQGLFPKHLGKVFLKVYGGIVDKRLSAKKAGNKKVSEGLKIAINGIFGKFGNIYSIVYAPDLLLQVTLTGQLTLLLLIEALELRGISVVSGNTDGIIIKCPKNKRWVVDEVIKAWEKSTGFTTEETLYKAIYSRDVNNYIAVKQDGTCKTKGVYCEKGSAQNSVLSKNPETLICSDAIQQLLCKDIPIEQTIRNCTDPRRFISVRTVKGGAVKDGRYLGKAIRWYYAKGEYGTINYKETGNKVPKTDGARPLMVLPAELPKDIDYSWYIKATNEMLLDIGYKKRIKPLSFF